MVCAAWVEGRATDHTLKTALQVLLDGQFGTASTAENRLLIPFTFRPDLDWMICHSRMAVFASVIDSATPHLDRDNIVWTVIVRAAYL